MKLTKRLKVLTVAGVALVVLVVVGAVVWIDHLAKAGIETGSTFALGVDTTLDRADVGILAGHTDLSGLRVGNPADYSTEHFLRLNDGSLHVSLASLTLDTIEVPSLMLTGVDVNLEKKGSSAESVGRVHLLRRYLSRASFRCLASLPRFGGAAGPPRGGG
jgi:hypothetical protein